MKRVYRQSGPWCECGHPLEQHEDNGKHEQPCIALDKLDGVERVCPCTNYFHEPSVPEHDDGGGPRE